MCGIVGVAGTGEFQAFPIVVRGMDALQHRGQEAAGVVTGDIHQNGGGNYSHYHYQHRAPGLVSDGFGEGSACPPMHGAFALGHVRYSTAGEKHHSYAAQVSDAQPLVEGGIALVHNGNLTNADALREELEARGMRFNSRVDTHVLMRLLIHAKGATFLDRLQATLAQVVGAYSLIIMQGQKLVGVCDPRGIRPLFLGRVGDAYMFASETCAFDAVRGEIIREVEPGEIIVIKHGAIHETARLQEKARPRPCIFEHIYFSRPDSDWGGYNMAQSRMSLGRQLAQEEDIDFCPSDTIVAPVLDSGFYAAQGYAEEANLPFRLGLVRNHYAIGRSFIEPVQALRDLKVRGKHAVNRSMVRGKRVVLVDDSVVRGTTSRLLVEMLFDAGAREVHLRIASPPTQYECRHGIDTKIGELLVTNCASITLAQEALEHASGATSARYLSIESTAYAMFGSSDIASRCTACFTGDYPTAV